MSTKFLFFLQDIKFKIEVMLSIHDNIKIREMNKDSHGYTHTKYAYAIIIMVLIKIRRINMTFVYRQAFTGPLPRQMTLDELIRRYYKGSPK